MKIKNLLFSFTLSASILLTGCYGSFSLVTSVHEWNGTVTGNKFAQELLFIGLNIIPVYGISAFADVLILNTIEFWTGTNPLAMKEGDEEIKYVKSKGQRYKITAVPNRFIIEQENGGMVSLKYEPEELAWYLESEGCCQKLTQFEFRNNRKTIRQFFPNGSSKSIDI